MNEPEMTSPAPADLSGQVASLQQQVFTLLLALIVVSGTLVAYLFYESHHIGKQIDALNAQIIQPYRQKLPLIESFVNQLAAYGQTHPDFRPLLQKYGINPQTPGATNAPKK